MRPGRDPLRLHEQVLLEECGVTVVPQRFPCLTDLSVARVARPLRAAAERHRAAAPEALALQRGIARQPGDVDARWFAHAVALDVSPTLARSLDDRHVRTPPWATAHVGTPMTWALLDAFALRGALFRAPGTAAPGYYGP